MTYLSTPKWGNWAPRWCHSENGRRERVQQSAGLKNKTKTTKKRKPSHDDTLSSWKRWLFCLLWNGFLGWRDHASTASGHQWKRPTLWESSREQTGTLISLIAQVQCSALNSGNMYIKSYGFLRYTGHYHLETLWRHLSINKSIVQLYIGKTKRQMNSAKHYVNITYHTVQLIQMYIYKSVMWHPPYT